MKRCEGCAACPSRRLVEVTVTDIRKIHYGYVWSWECEKGHRVSSWQKTGGS